MTLLGYSVVAASIGTVKRTSERSKMFFIAAVFVPALLSAFSFVIERNWSAPPNSLMVIAPYRHAGTWVFDDPQVGLKAEPFVSGIPEMIDKMVADAKIKDADRGFRLIFSTDPFPGYQTKIVWRRAENGGNWYYSEDYKAEGWLCPALFKYFKKAPKQIYVKAEAKGMSN